ncbi:MAG TPA: right-handed parallel beta-helix repeat-containing protein [Treponemataceae bacterium]|nr:right-handed parallel beta-helix repeat-containing protein [Treponemataceae bacterium]
MRVFFYIALSCFLCSCTVSKSTPYSDIFASKVVTLDDTQQLQLLLDSPEDLIVIPYREHPWITEPLFLRTTNKRIVFEEGCTIIAKKGQFLDTGDSLLSIHDSHNIEIEGYNAILQMHKKDYMSAPYEKGQWRHGISLRRSSNIRISGLEIRETGGDGVYIGQNRGDPVCENIELIDLKLVENYRQGVSVISVRNFLIDNCTVSGTSGTLPMAGIDFEPNSDLYGFTGCVVRNCVFLNNKGPGILIYLKKLTPNHPFTDIKIQDCISKKNNFSINVQVPKGVNGKVIISNCDFSWFKLIRTPKTFMVEFNN